MELISNTEDTLRILSEKLSSVPRIGLDFETTSSHPHPDAPLHHDKLEVVGYGIGFPNGDKTYVPLAHHEGLYSSKNADRNLAIPILKSLLGDHSKEIWAHNAKFETIVARSMQIDVQAKMRCSLLAQHLLNKSLDKGRGLKLKPAVKKYLKYTMKEYENILPKKGRAHEVSVKKMALYCTDDAFYCLKLGELWMPEIKEWGLEKLFIELECQFMHVLVHMREVGFAIDENVLINLNSQFNEILEECSRGFIKVVGEYTPSGEPISISSNVQVSSQLYDTLKWWPAESLGFRRGKSGNYSVDKKHLERLNSVLKEGTKAFSALRYKQQYNQFATLNSTFTLPLVESAKLWSDGRLRCDFNQAGTPTGRLSSSGPNFQNIPKQGDGYKIREAFVPSEGNTLVVCDYSQAELRMMAHLSCDKALLDAYNKEGIDVHSQTSTACGCTRHQAKIINFGLIYGEGEKTLAAELKSSLREAKLFYSKFFGLYKGVKKYHADIEQYCVDNGYVRTVTGRRRYFPDITSKNEYRRGEALRACFNTPVQGSVGEIMKIAMRNLYFDWKNRGIIFDYYTNKGKAKIVSMVHDELICDVPEDFAMEAAADIKRHMENAVKLRVPMIAEPGIGKNWIEGKGNIVQI